MKRPITVWLLADNNDHSSAGSFNPSCRSSTGTSKILHRITIDLDKL